MTAHLPRLLSKQYPRMHRTRTFASLQLSVMNHLRFSAPSTSSCRFRACLWRLWWKLFVSAEKGTSSGGLQYIPHQCDLCNERPWFHSVCHASCLWLIFLQLAVYAGSLQCTNHCWQRHENCINCSARWRQPSYIKGKKFYSKYHEIKMSRRRVTRVYNRNRCKHKAALIQLCAKAVFILGM